METNLLGEKLDPRRGLAHWIRLLGGLLLVLVGLVGLVVPIIPGIPLLLAGLAMLSCEYMWARRWHERLLCWWKELRARMKSDL